MKYSFVRNARFGYFFSAILMLLSFAAFGYQYQQSGTFLRYGIDFTGGTRIEIQGDDLSNEAIESALNEYESFSPQVASIGNNSFMIKLKPMSNEENEALMTHFQDTLPAFEQTLLSTIGPTIGDSLKSKAVTALIVALVAIILFIAWAFQETKQHFSSWKFGLAAIIALVHDVIITLGAFAIMGIVSNAEIDALFVTALLTLIGFSVHDTIVVFDRVRENSRRAKARSTLADIADESIHQTIARSINTSISTLIPLGILYFYNIESIKFFVLALIVGILIGTYSSIFLATPILVTLHDND